MLLFLEVTKNGSNKLTSRALNKLSMQLFVMREGIINFVSVGSRRLMNSKIAIRCRMFWKR